MGFGERDNEFSDSIKGAEVNQSLHMRLQRNLIELRCLEVVFGVMK
jgi:hypothetical protein